MSPLVPEAEPTAPARLVTLRGGARWMATAVARLSVDDPGLGTESARLILRLECLSNPRSLARIATVAASSLDDVDDEILCRLASSRRRAPGVLRRTAARPADKNTGPKERC